MRKGWEYKKLGEVCDITMGQSPNGNSINDFNGVEFHQGKTYFGERFLDISPLYSNAPTKLAEAHSVLLCVRAPVGYPNITDRKICIGRGLCALYAKKEIHNTFLYYSLLGKQSYFEKNATGSTFKAISSKTVSNTTLSLPPISTQLSIVSELDKINELIRLKKKQLKDFDNLAQSIFYEMFGDPVENERGWEIKKLGEIGEVKTGNTPSRSNDNFYNEKFIEWIKTDNIRTEQMNPTTAAEYLSKEGAECGRIVGKGSILVACIAGSLSSIGKCCITTKNVAFNQQINAITPYEDFCNSIYLYELIRNSSKYIQQNATTGMKHILSKSIFEKIPIPLPPLPLQHLFAQRIEQIEHQKAEVQKSITNLETLLASRMQYWFE